MDLVAQRDEAVRDRDKFATAAASHQQALASETEQRAIAEAALIRGQAELRAVVDERDVAVANVSYFTRQLKEHEQVVSETEQLLAAELELERSKAFSQSGLNSFLYEYDVWFA